MMKVLVGCEVSGTVRNAFLDAGHDAWSCDLLPTEKPGPHITGDVLDVLNEGWDLAIFHPECTYLTCSAEWAYGPGPYHQKVKPGTLTGEARKQARQKAKEFVLKLWNAPIKRIAIENPVGVLTGILGKPQVVQPWQFGDDASKATCLWMKNLPRLIIGPEKFAAPRIVNGKKRWANQTDTGQNRLSPSENRKSQRSLTYKGIARAIVEAWG